MRDAQSSTLAYVLASIGAGWRHRSGWGFHVALGGLSVLSPTAWIRWSAPAAPREPEATEASPG